MPKLLCLLFIVLIANVDLSGQLPNFSFQHYSSENGYPVKESFSVGLSSLNKQDVIRDMTK